MRLYEKDESEWRERMIDLLESGQLSEIDSVNLRVMLIEMGLKEKAEIENRLSLLIMHVLKAMYQPERASRSWFLTIREQKKQLNRFLNKSKNLKKHAENFWGEAYQEARVDAHYETELSLDRFPLEPDFSFEQVLDPEWFPPSIEIFR